MRAFAQLVGRVADAPGQPAETGAGPFVIERVGVRDVQVGGADVLVNVPALPGVTRPRVTRLGVTRLGVTRLGVTAALVVVPGVEGQVQAHCVAFGETVAVAVGVGQHVETERRVVREGTPQVAHRENRAEALQPRPGRHRFFHGTSLPQA
jgi:hypothetical protein